MKLPGFYFGSDKICTYCGDDAREVDHVIPVAFQTYYRGYRRCRENFGPMTFSCGKCNRKLTDKGFDSFEERCRFISGQYNAEAHAVIWSNREIETLEGKLKDEIKHLRQVRLYNRFRSDWFQSRDYLLNIESLMWEPVLDKKHTRHNKFLSDYFNTTVIILDAIQWKSKY